MVATYNDVLALWTLKRDIQETKRMQELELLVMRLRDAVRPATLMTSVHALEDASSPLMLFDTHHSNDMCEEACEKVNESLPTWIRTSAVCGVMYVTVT